MNTRADLLMLDEPTNHLDLSGIEVLQEALKSFAGAVLLISHDHRLVGGPMMGQGGAAQVAPRAVPVHRAGRKS